MTDNRRNAIAAEPTPPAPQDAAAAPFGSYAPNAAGRLGLAFGRRLPPGRAGLRLAGIGRPLALAGLKGDIADIEALGLKLRLHPKDNLCEKRLFMTPQCFDPVELAALRRAMGPGKIFIDIGANIGAYALVAAMAGGPSARVIAVEPQRTLRARLAYNARINDLANIVISEVALSDYEGESVMRMVADNKGRGRLGGDGALGDAVRVTTLKTLLEERRIPRLDVMKIDVEGGEARILAAYFSDVDRALWPALIILERPEVNGLDRADNAVALACAHGYRLAAETRLNALLELVSQPPVEK